MQVVEPWFGQLSHSVVTRSCVCWIEILDPCVCQYASAIGNGFVLMDDNVQPHRAAVMEDYLRPKVMREWNGKFNLQI